MTDLPTPLALARDSGLISAQSLLEALQTTPERIKLVDASYPPNPSLPAIGDAVTFDIDDIADPDSPMAHMLPSPEIFAEKVGALGISNDDFVICYDQSGPVMAASRAWWMFRAFGHDNVAVLDGGLIGWIQKNYPVGEKQPPSPARFEASFRPELVVDYDQMKSLSESGEALIYDARPPQRFAPEHIPGSANLPALSLIGPDRLLNPTGLDLPPDSKIVTTCGSGVTACVIALALFREGHKEVPVYDGSWTEWSSR